MRWVRGALSLKNLGSGSGESSRALQAPARRIKVTRDSRRSSYLSRPAENSNREERWIGCCSCCSIGYGLASWVRSPSSSRTRSCAGRSGFRALWRWTSRRHLGRPCIMAGCSAAKALLQNRVKATTKEPPAIAHDLDHPLRSSRERQRLVCRGRPRRLAASPYRKLNPASLTSESL